MKAITVEPKKPGTARLEDIAEPDPCEGTVLVEAVAVGVFGTDVEIVEGKYGWAPPGEKRLMLGHESLGRVLDPGPRTGLQKGDVVAGIVLTLFLLGLLLEPATVVAKAWEQVAAIGHRAFWEPRSVLVTGAGRIGLLAASGTDARRSSPPSASPNLVRNVPRTKGAQPELYARVRRDGGQRAVRRGRVAPARPAFGSRLLAVPFQLRRTEDQALAARGRRPPRRPFGTRKPKRDAHGGSLRNWIVVCRRAI